MKDWKKTMLFSCLVLASISAYSQNKLKGIVLDQEFSQGLVGSTILVKGTQNGVSANVDGDFELDIPQENGEIVVSFIGYQSKTFSFKVGADKVFDFGTITLTSDDNLLDDIVIMGVADIAKDRKTPVAVSTIKAAQIQEKLGSQEFPEILNTTPSVYASKGGGGYGDSNINIRGFDQRNIAVLINGMPVNDMEGGAVYWSNWAGLSDVTSAVQVQRGLGSSKIAISSVGGTINVLTKTADAHAGGSLLAGIGNNDYFKGLASYNTGLLENGLSASVLMGYTRGNGYVDGTKFEGTNYFIGLGYRSKNSKHNVQLTFTGANQWHNQRSTYSKISDYIKYGEEDKPNKKYNSDFGYYNGEEFSWRRNYYNKPVASINWDFNITDKLTLGTVVYGSWGRGGGNGALGTINGKGDRDDMFRDANGRVRFDDIDKWNRGGEVADFGARKKGFAGPEGGFVTDGTNTFGPKTSTGGFVRRANINSHDWYGTIINLNNKINENWTVDLGVDARTYVGYHFQLLDNLMGAPGFYDNGSKSIDGRVVTDTYTSKAPFNPWADWSDRNKISYDNDGEVKWLGGFGQVEYSKDNISVFVQGSISDQWFRRTDYATYDRRTEQGAKDYKTSWKKLTGGSVKGGINYNINENHNVFVNSGYFSRQPFMTNGVYVNRRNDLNPQLKNEQIFGLEFGYGLRTDKLRANLNLYRTSWKDRIINATQNDIYGSKANKEMPSVDAYANLYGVEQVHMGMEVDFLYRLMDRLDITGSFSWGDWKYSGSVTTDFLNQADNSPIEDLNNPGQYLKKTVYLDGVKVGDAPQFVVNLGAAYEIFDGFKVDGNYRYNDKFYALVDPLAFSKPEHKGSMSLPSFALFDAGMSYKLRVGKDKRKSLNIRVNVNNLFDTTYISASRTNIQTGDVNDRGQVISAGKNWKGVDVNNEVYFGAGRTWNFTMRYNF